MSGLSFADVLDDSILVYVEDHASFVAWIGEKTGGGSEQMAVDMEKQQITYVPRLHKRDEVVARIHLLGSVAARPRSAMWAWANPQFATAPVARMSHRVREFGESRGIPELRDPEVAIGDEEPPGTDRLTDFATAMAATSCRITGIPAAQIMSAGPTRVVMLVDAAGFVPPPPSGVTFPRVLASAIGAAGWVHDHRRAAQGYAQARNLNYGWESDFSALNIGFSEGNVRVVFDAAGRVADIQTEFRRPEQS